MKLFIWCLVCLCERLAAAIHSLNDSDYYKMPRIFHLDDYEECVHQPGWVYCSVEMLLVSNQSSPLLLQIQEYSKHTSRHYNHAKLQYGVCIKRTCNKYINIQNNTDLAAAIEACYSDILWQKHKLRVKIVGDVKCSTSNDTVDVEAGDVIVAAVLGIVLTLNCIGSIYDVFKKRIQNKRGPNFWMSFSIFNNLKKLFFLKQNRSPYFERRTSIQGLDGLRCLCLMFILLGHSPIGFVSSIDNPRFIEQTYENLSSYLLFNGTLLVQIFFVLTSFLLAYKFLLGFKQHISWTLLLKTILLRYIRLTSSYAIVLAFEATLLRFTKSGPLWWNVVDIEIGGCRQNWWSHLLYINNYVTTSQCLPQSWYLAADMQLYVVGVFVFGLATKPYVRNVILSLLFIGGILITSIHTYLQDLDGYLLMTPENSRTLLMDDATFHYVYRTGHNNVVCSVMGLATGCFVHNMQKKKLDINKYKKYVFIYWATVPSSIGLLIFGSVLYKDAPRVPLMARVVYAAAIKPIFGLIIVTIILGIVFKIENIYRGVLEWSVWGPLARLSYCVFLVHVVLIRTAAATHTTLMHSSIYGILSYSIGMLAASHVAAFPLWVLVEAPVSNLTRLYFGKRDDGVNYEINLKGDDMTNVNVNS